MLYFVIGMPGVFAEWCERVTAALATRAGAATEILYASSLEALTLGLLQTGASDAVVAARQAGGRLRAAVTDSENKFIVALDDPRRALADLVLHKGMGLIAATRAVASGCAGMEGYAATPGALCLHAQTAGNDAVAIAAAIAKHLELVVSDAEIAAIVAARASEDVRRHDAESWWATLSAEDIAMVEGALAGYLGPEDVGAIRFINWTRDLFSPGDRPDEALEEVIDITGRARCLIEGPFIVLPHGAWRTKLRLAFSASAADYTFTLEVVAGDRLVARTIQPSQDSARDYNLDFTIDERIDHPVSLRLSNQRAVFDGTVSLTEMRLAGQPVS